MARLADVLGPKNELFVVLSDIHANLPALESVCADLTRWNPTQAIILGDLVGYGPYPNETCAFIRKGLRLSVSLLKKVKVPSRVIAGNHDEWASGSREFTAKTRSRARNSHRWTQDELDDGHKKYLRKLDRQVVAGEVGFFHASPASPEEYRYVDPLGFIPEEVRREYCARPWTDWLRSKYCRLILKPAFRRMQELGLRVCFVGHSHRPGLIGLRQEGLVFPAPHESNREEKTRSDSFKLDEDALWIVNAGSVGFPRDGDNRACYAVYDAGAGLLTLVRIAYDVQRTVKEYARKDAGDKTRQGKTRLMKHTLEELVSLLERGRSHKGAFGLPD